MVQINDIINVNHKLLVCMLKKYGLLSKINDVKNLYNRNERNEQMGLLLLYNVQAIVRVVGWVSEFLLPSEHTQYTMKNGIVEKQHVEHRSSMQDRAKKREDPSINYKLSNWVNQLM